jgi:hypothetical protein
MDNTAKLSRWRMSSSGYCCYVGPTFRLFPSAYLAKLRAMMDDVGANVTHLDGMKST